MKSIYTKLFLDKLNNEIIHIKYSPKINDYYDIVRENHKKGYRQIIITSKIMTDIMKYYFYNKSFRISSIEFMEENKDLKDDIYKILKFLCK